MDIMFEMALILSRTSTPAGLLFTFAETEVLVGIDLMTE